MAATMKALAGSVTSSWTTMTSRSSPCRGRICWARGCTRREQDAAGHASGVSSPYRTGSSVKPPRGGRRVASVLASAAKTIHVSWATSPGRRNALASQPAPDLGSGRGLVAGDLGGQRGEGGGACPRQQLVGRQEVDRDPSDIRSTTRRARWPPGGAPSAPAVDRRAALVPPPADRCSGVALRCLRPCASDFPWHLRARFARVWRVADGNAAAHAGHRAHDLAVRAARDRAARGARAG